MPRGTVKSSDNPYILFLAPEDGSEDVQVSWQALVTVGIGSEQMTVGTVVEFEYRASVVRIVEPGT